MQGARYLHLVDTPGGTLLKGRLDTMAGHRVRLALEAATPRPATDDERTSEQRRADALDALASRLLADPRTGPGAAVPPQVSVVLSERAWRAATAELARRRAAAEGDVGCPVDGEGAPATLEDGTPVPGSEVARILCEAALTRIVLDAEGELLDVGRAQRLYTGQLRRAIIARDRHCVWPGCAAPPRWCEVHHIDWWDRDEGATSATNGALLCSFHHHQVHERDLTLVRHPRGEGAVGVSEVGYAIHERAGPALARAG